MAFEPTEVAALVRGTVAMLETKLATLPKSLLQWHPAAGNSA